MSSRRTRRKLIRKSRADSHRAQCEKGHWKAAALLLGFQEAHDDIDYHLVVHGWVRLSKTRAMYKHFDDPGSNPWKDAVEWWEITHETLRENGIGADGICQFPND